MNQNLNGIKVVAILVKDLTSTKINEELTARQEVINVREVDDCYMAVEDKLNKETLTYRELYTAFLTQLRDDINNLLKD